MRLCILTDRQWHPTQTHKTSKNHSIDNCLKRRNEALKAGLTFDLNAFWYGLLSLVIGAQSVQIDPSGQIFKVTTQSQDNMPLCS
jgi:hypothetical protein